MADGSARAAGAVRAATVADLMAGERALVAACGDPRCGAQAVIAGPGAWPPALRLASVARLEEALRCRCGARRGVLTSRPYWGPRPPMTGGVYLFVA